jgi:hypothetical protein
VKLAHVLDGNGAQRLELLVEGRRITYVVRFVLLRPVACEGAGHDRLRLAALKLEARKIEVAKRRKLALYVNTQGALGG